MSVCRSCEAPIVWAKTDKGRMMPMDAVRTDEGGVAIATVDDAGAVSAATANVVVIGVAPTDRGMVPLVRVVPRGKGKAISHWSTCPNSDDHRRR